MELQFYLVCSKIAQITKVTFFNYDSDLKSDTIYVGNSSTLHTGFFVCWVYGYICMGMCPKCLRKSLIPKKNPNALTYELDAARNAHLRYIVAAMLGHESRAALKVVGTTVTRF